MIADVSIETDCLPNKCLTSYQIEKMLVIWKIKCDVIWFWCVWIVKTWDRHDWTKWYVWSVWSWEWKDELTDVKLIIDLGTKFTEEQIWVLKAWFKPYKNFKSIDYDACDVWWLSPCCWAKVVKGLCSYCQEHA